MAKRKKTLEDYIKEKTELLEKSDGIFYEALDDVEDKIFVLTKKGLKRFKKANGRLESDKTNLQLLNFLGKEIQVIIDRSGLKNAFDKYLLNFDEVEKLNKAIYKDELDEPITLNFSAEKQLAIDDVSIAVGTRAGLQQNAVNPIRRTLFTAITTRMTEGDAVKQLELLVKGKKNTSGIIGKYVKQVTRDALNGYDGAINDKIRDEYELDGFRYLGSIALNTRDNCQHLVSGTGEFSDLRLPRRIYKVEDIPKIIKKAKDGDGFNAAVTPETFGQYRMGYNCRHQIRYVRIPESVKKQIEQ